MSIEDYQLIAADNFRRERTFALNNLVNEHTEKYLRFKKIRLRGGTLKKTTFERQHFQSMRVTYTHEI